MKQAILAQAILAQVLSSFLRACALTLHGCCWCSAVLSSLTAAWWTIDSLTLALYAQCRYDQGVASHVPNEEN